LSECPCRGWCWNFRSHSIRRVNSPNAGCERARENKRVILELEGLSLSLDFSVKLCDIIISFLPEFYLTMGMMIHPCARAAGVCPWRTPPTQWWRWHLRRPCWTGHTSWFMQPGSQHLVKGTYAQTSQVGGKHALKLLKMWIGLKILGNFRKSIGSSGSNRSCSLWNCHHVGCVPFSQKPITVASHLVLLIQCRTMLIHNLV